MDDRADPNLLSPSLAEISDGDLLAGTRHLVGASNQVLAALLTHLGEIEARGIYRTRACSSLYIYCVYELRFSEDAGFRRVPPSAQRAGSGRGLWAGVHRAKANDAA